MGSDHKRQFGRWLDGKWRTDQLRSQQGWDGRVQPLFSQGNWFSRHYCQYCRAGFYPHRVLESEAMQEGGDAETVPDIIPVGMTVLDDGKVSLVAPNEPGAYRLFVNIRDSLGLAGHANIPFLVESSQH